MRIYIRDFFTVFRIFSTPIYLFIIYLLNFLSTFFQRSRYSDDIGVKHVLYPLIPLNSTQCTLTVVCVCVYVRHDIKKSSCLKKQWNFPLCALCIQSVGSSHHTSFVLHLCYARLRHYLLLCLSPPANHSSEKVIEVYASCSSEACYIRHRVVM